MKRLALLWLVGGLAAACGDDVNDADPALIPGGGVGSGAIKGKVNVYVVDSDTDAPLSGAMVYVGNLSGSTDATGLHTFEDGSLSGPQTITATASGYAAGTWIGANGANVTIPLEPTGAGSVPSATVSGTIEGWDALPAPAQNHYYLAVIGYSWTREIGARENEIQTPSGIGGLPMNACINSQFLTQCDWTLKTRTGPQTHYAIVVDGDSKGNADFSDDTFVVYGFAVKRGVDLDADQTVTGEVLTMLDAADLQTATFSFPQAPAGLGEMAAIPVIDLGDELLPLIFPGVTPDDSTTTVPKLTGDFAGGAYMVIGRATPGMMMETPSTATITRDADLSSSFTLPAWLSTPTNLTASGGTYSFTPAAGATIHTVEFRTSAGEPAWNVGLLDGTTSFVLPALTPDALPAGMVTYRVSAIDVSNFDPADFSLDDLTDSLNRIADNEIDFTH